MTLLPQFVLKKKHNCLKIKSKKYQLQNQQEQDREI